MIRHLRLGRWCLTIQRGGTATPWPWTEVRLSRRKPKPEVRP